MSLKLPAKYFELYGESNNYSFTKYFICDANDRFICEVDGLEDVKIIVQALNHGKAIGKATSEKGSLV